MEIKNSETESEKSKITAYTEEEILALIDFACTVSTPISIMDHILGSKEPIIYML
jgi:hypothetical protein